MDTFKQPWVTYLCFFIALGAMISALFFPGYTEILWVIAGLGGFTGAASVRSFINSSGYKTYFVLAIYVIPAVLMGFKVITLEQFGALMTLLTSLLAATYQQALSKANGNNLKKAD